MHLQRKTLLSTWLYFLYGLMVSCYDIPQINLEKLQRGFRVSIPVEYGTSLVVFHISINKQYSIMDLITEQRDNAWIKEHPEEELYENDEVRVQVVAGHTSGLIYRSDNFRISKNSTIIYTHTAQADMQSAIETSETRVHFQKSPIEKTFKPNDLIFEDNFEKLDASKWTHDIFMYTNLNDNTEDFTMYTDDDVHTEVNHTLYITPTLSERQARESFELPRCTPAVCTQDKNATCVYKKTNNRRYTILPPVHSARISTRNTFSFTYGRVEIRAKLPLGAWLFPSIMLEPDNPNCNNRKQLRIAFATFDPLTQFHIRAGPVKLVNSDITNRNFERTSDMAVKRNIRPYMYHNFTLVWTSKGISTYVDNQKFGCFVNDGEYDEPYHLVLGVSAGGHLEFPDSASKPWKNGYLDAALQFKRSFQDCCSRRGEPKCVDTLSKERICSRTWTPHATMAIKYVRVYAV